MQPAVLRDELRRNPLGPGAVLTDAYEGMAILRTRNDALAKAKTNLKFVSWGDEPYKTPLLTTGEIMERFYGGYAFRHFRG